MIVLLWALIFFVSLAVLVKASDYFTGAASAIGLNLGVTSFVIGVTVVGAGTSMPELVSSFIGALEGAPEIVAGNVIGSNIFNIFLIVGVAAVIGGRMHIRHPALLLDLFFLLSSSLLLTLCAWDRTFTRPEAAICLLSYLIYVLYNLSSGKEKRDLVVHMLEVVENPTEELQGQKEDKPEPPLWRNVAILGLSGVFLVLGAKFTVDAVIRISELLRIATDLIAVSAVAAGTSLPELAVSAVAARKKEPEMAMGNIVGSNIFNALVVMGLPGLFGTLPVRGDLAVFGLPVMVVATLLYIHMAHDREITAWEGWTMILIYVFFLGKILGLI